MGAVQIGADESRVAQQHQRAPHGLGVRATGAGTLAFAGSLMLVPEDPSRTGGRVDYVGAVLLGAALVNLLFPLSETADWGWGSFKVIGLLVTGPKWSRLSESN